MTSWLRGVAVRSGGRLAPVGRRTWAFTRQASGNHPAIASVCAVLALGLGIGAWLFPRSADAPTPASGFGAPPPSASSVPALDVVPAVNPVRGVRAQNGDDVYIFDRPIETLPPPPAGFELNREIGVTWARANGGLDADLTFVELVIQGRNSRSVVLTDLQIKVLHRNPPPARVAVDLTQSGDGVDGRNARVDLDAPVPRLADMVDYTDGEPWAFPLRVSEEAVEVIYLWVGSAQCDCEWVAELHFVADGSAQTVKVDNNGTPFRTIASTGSDLYLIQEGRFVRKR